MSLELRVRELRVGRWVLGKGMKMVRRMSEERERDVFAMYAERWNLMVDERPEAGAG
jgi:hypothetical protein